MTLSDSISSKNTGKPITVNAIISSVAESSYSCPLEISLSCARTCKASRDCHFTGKQQLTVDSARSIRFVDLSEFYFKRTIQAITGMECSKFSYSVLKTQSLTKIFITSMIDSKTIACFLIGNGIEVNRTYELSGTVVADPRTQTTTAVFTSAKPINSAIESFAITKESHDSLSDFCYKGDAEKTLVHLLELYKSYAANITHIYDRFDLHMACDLVFHSPLSFVFDGEYFHKGWADAAIIGDTRVGKGFVAEGLRNHYGVSEIISGDNSNFAGLVGGLDRRDKSWMVKWGALVRNDGGMVILDESSKLDRKLITRLTNIRSSGIAEIHKIQSYTAQARTRLLFLLNPGNGKNISQFPFGIESILSVFKDPATVSRFDFVLVVSKDEADIDSVNKARVSVPLMYSQDQERNLIYWIWSRKKNEIVFSKEAVDRCYMLALDLADRYCFDVPLIQGENIRYKLAKLAACIAGRLYSNKHKGRQLFVDAVHVECAWTFLEIIYKKKASSYYALSMIKKSLEHSQGKTGIDAISFYFQSFPTKRTSILQSLLISPTITMNDIKEQTGLPQDIALEIISKLVKNKLIERRGFTYVRSDVFSTWLRDELTQ